MNVDTAEDITQADYQMAILNTRAFGYESIRDTQENKEFWVNIAAVVVIIGVGLVFPPAGIALGAVYGTAELTSAVTGKDWVSGRELGTGERWFRGALAPLDIIPGAAAVKSFSSVASISSFTEKLDILGKTTTLTNKTQSSMQKVSDLALTAKTETIARLKQADAFIIKKEKEVLQKVVDGALGTARVVDETLANVQNGFSIFNKGPEFVTVGGDFKGTTTPIPSIQNVLRDRLSKYEGLNIREGGAGWKSKLKVEDFNPKTATNKQKRNYGEMVSSDHILKNQSLKDAGYDLRPVGRGAPTSIDDKIVHGIDGLYENMNINSPIRYVIDEAKFGSSQLNLNTRDKRQMSNTWLTGEISGRNRILKAVCGDEELAEMIADLLKKNGVERVLSKVDSASNVKTLKLDVDGKIIGDWP